MIIIGSPRMTSPPYVMTMGSVDGFLVDAVDETRGIFAMNLASLRVLKHRGAGSLRPDDPDES